MTSRRDPLSDGIAIGPDKVLVYDDKIVVCSTRDMPDWQIREFCRIPIYFRGVKFYVRRKSRMNPPYVVGYELEPWPEEFQGESTMIITYDEQYVKDRERLVHSDSRNEFERNLLLAIYPFLGFLWSNFKDRQLERFGLNSRSITEGSLLVQLAFVLFECVFLLMFRIGFIETALGFPGIWLDCVLFAAAIADLLVRANQMLQNAEQPYGFFEWMVRIIVRPRHVSNGRGDRGLSAKSRKG
jgi:hypothetical protein